MEVKSKTETSNKQNSHFSAYARQIYATNAKKISDYISLYLGDNAVAFMVYFSFQTLSLRLSAIFQQLNSSVKKRKKEKGTYQSTQLQNCDFLCFKGKPLGV